MVYVFESVSGHSEYRTRDSDVAVVVKSIEAFILEDSQQEAVLLSRN